MNVRVEERNPFAWLRRMRSYRGAQTHRDKQTRRNTHGNSVKDFSLDTGLPHTVGDFAPGVGEGTTALGRRLTPELAAGESNKASEASNLKIAASFNVR
jgi:hypothetical protein